MLLFLPPLVPSNSDHRLRGYFGDRYDARANLCDWDYHMRLKAVVSTRAQGRGDGQGGDAGVQGGGAAACPLHGSVEARSYAVMLVVYSQFLLFFCGLQASIIHVIHYKKWRMSGVAFEER